MMSLEILQDDAPTNFIEECDLLGRIICWHPRYNLGHRHNFETDQELFDSIGKAVILPIYIYEHGGRAISTTPFSDPCDSDHIGFVYAEHDKIFAQYNKGKMTKNLKKSVEETLAKEVSLYNDFINGEVYGYVIKDESGAEIHSCWGFVGDPRKSGLMEQAFEAMQF